VFDAWRGSDEARELNEQALNDWFGANPSLAQLLIMSSSGFACEPRQAILSRLSFEPRWIFDGLALPTHSALAHTDLTWDQAAAPSAIEESDGRWRLQGSLQLMADDAGATSLVTLAESADGPLLVTADLPRSLASDSPLVTLGDLDVRTIARGEQARRINAELLRWQRVGLLGVAVGIIDRSWLVIREAVTRARDERVEIAYEQGPEMRLAEVDIAREAAVLLALEATTNPASSDTEGLATARAWTSDSARSCAAVARLVVKMLDHRLDELAVALEARAIEISAALYPIFVEHRRAAEALAATWVAA
jgi:hypothetical protein